MSKPGWREWVAAGKALRGGNLLRNEGPRQLTVGFEKHFASYIGSEHALALTSGTVALHAAMTAIGVGPGDEVLVPAYTWIASAAAPALAGAVPILVDIDETLTIDPADIERKITPQTRAILPVHMVNAPCNMDAIMDIARRHNLVVVEDACQAVGIEYKGRKLGSFGAIGAFSFNHYKNMTIGEGGAVVTNDPNLFSRLMNFHDLGIWARDGYEAGNEPAFLASHSRMTEVQGAMLDVQLSRLPAAVAAMTRNRKIVADILRERNGPRISPHNDPDSAAGLTVIFDTAEEASEFAKRPAVHRIYDNSKHVYTNWDPILNHRTAHPAMNPWAWSKRPVHYDENTCARTLDIMRRSCKITISPGWSPVLARILAKTLWTPGAPDSAAYRLIERVQGR
ncbi:DegT/DnrJ/EryC1/StrS family aminotransferase [Qipengyuania soli]|uniref:DegT/DnrJ/EryC1/StrS family aminotransferase n=1 Tax=Qipengyuania soli TaxID=2782568 RepID=A0A7S8F4S0_9SPHN|nr:DegT/DnrJ/EryC1/StrS family aminotransferase [Qipengyuania soli]QPC99147.1 DegT/DnrJ/EryC1/StrS family aminotransferase [Qipengyuania soli]